jgi:hypothetical protein
LVTKVKSIEEKYFENASKTFVRAETKVDKALKIIGLIAKSILRQKQGGRSTNYELND